MNHAAGAREQQAGSQPRPAVECRRRTGASRGEAGYPFTSVHFCCHSL